LISNTGHHAGLPVNLYFRAVKQAGKIIILTGILLIIAGGILLTFGDRSGGLGRLPGDIRIKKPTFSFYFPITTMILLSIVLTLILWIIQKIFR
jgi:hypothetical protein